MVSLTSRKKSMQKPQEIKTFLTFSSHVFYDALKNKFYKFVSDK